MAEKITVADALSVVVAAVVAVNAVAETTNLALQGVLGSLVGGIGAFNKNESKLNEFIEKALKELEACKTLRRYVPVFVDYIENETGIVAEDGGYKFPQNKAARAALDSAQQGVKSLCVADYKSAAKKKEIEEKKAVKAQAKTAFTNASPKDRIILMLNTAMADANSRIEKEDKKGKKGSEKEIQKVRSEKAYIEKLIAFMDAQA
jgi:hypothetical protein